jgi:hypothetical protein
MKVILQRGHIHPVFTLNTNNPAVNPSIQFETYKLKARNSVGTVDADERNSISKLLRTFITNKYYMDNEAFDNTAKTNFTTL